MNINDAYLRKKNIFAIPAGDFFDSDLNACFLVYSPLANQFFLALPDEVVKLDNLERTEQPNDTLKALSRYVPLKDRNPYGEGYDSTATFYLILNEKCNFSCKYCYSAEGRSKDELSLEKIFTALDYFLSNDRKAPKNRTVMFIGGGEPLLSWPLVEQTTLYAEKVAAENGIELKKELSTNGSILTPQILDFYKKHQFGIQFSFDVIPEVQNEQREAFDRVSSNLRQLCENDVPCRIRSTITELNVSRIDEMVALCHQAYPKVTSITCEPVVDPGYFTAPEIVQSFFGKFFNAFIKAQQLANKYAIVLFSTSSGAIRKLRERFCFNMYCITPYGTYTTCPNVSSPNETGYESAVFGEVKDNRVLFNDEAYRALSTKMIHTSAKCLDCWAKWNCGGGCPNQRLVYSSEIFDEICVFMRKMLLYQLMSELSEKYRKSTGTELYAKISTVLKNRQT